MKFHALHFNWLWHTEAVFIIGIAMGRVHCEPEARWLYSLRLFCGIFKIEMLWKTGTISQP